MYDEVNTRCNLPAQIDIEAVEGDEYRFIMVAKGGGSANKTYFYPMTKATIQNEGTLLPFLVEKMKSLGTAACPPYHICFVIGGTSAEKNLLTVKLGSIKYYDNLPTTGDETGRAFRDIDLEEKLLKEAHKIGLGAQFGGKYLAHDIRVIRLPRHGASCPIGMGVSCSADRNIKAKINADGISGLLRLREIDGGLHGLQRLLRRRLPRRAQGGNQDGHLSFLLPHVGGQGAGPPFPGEEPLPQGGFAARARRGAHGLADQPGGRSGGDVSAGAGLAAGGATGVESLSDPLHQSVVCAETHAAGSRPGRQLFCLDSALWRVYASLQTHLLATVAGRKSEGNPRRCGHQRL